jgi:hypothetical protein
MNRKITINPVFEFSEIENKYVLVSHDGVYKYDGPMMLACSSGGEIAKTDEELQQSQAAMTNTLNTDYSTTFAEQQGVLKNLQAKMNYIAANPMGYTPAQLAGAKTAINENTATAAKQAIGSAAAFAASRGGADVGNGAVGEVAGQIGSAAAQSKSQQLSSLTQQNEELKQKNFWNAISGLNSVGSELGGAGGTAIGGAGSAANSSVGAGSGALAAQQAGWQDLGSVMSGIGGLAEAGVGAYSAVDTAQNT